MDSYRNPGMAELHRLPPPDGVDASIVSRRVTVATLDQVPEGTMHMVQVDGTDILLVHRDGLHALQGICSHEYFELDKGFLTGDSVTCALHLSRFDLARRGP